MRRALPDRRPSLTTVVHWNGHSVAVTVGLHPETGTPLEVFADTAPGGQMQWVIADACVIISLALQFGATPAELAKSLGRVPVLWAEGETQPASPLGAIVEAIMAEASA